MTLHEAIRRVLLEANHPLTASAIADRINDAGLYKRKDKAAVPPGQIEARIQNYPDEFLIEKNKILLKQFDSEAAVDERISRMCKTIQNDLHAQSSLNDYNFIELFLTFLIDDNSKYSGDESVKNSRELLRSHIESRALNTNFELYLISRLRELKDVVQENSNLAHAIKVVCSHFLSARSGKGLSELPSTVINLLSNKIKLNNIRSIDVLDNSIPLYLLDLLDNKKAYRICLDTIILETKKLTELILRASGINVDLQSVSENTKSDLGICLPPFGLKTNMSGWENEFEAIHGQYQRLNSDSYQILVAATGIFFKGGIIKSARKFTLTDFTPSGIYTIPFESKITAIKALAFVEFDYSKRSGKIFVGDFVSEENKDRIIQTIEGRELIDGVTAYITTDEIYQNDNNWTPRRYLSIPILDAVNLGETLELEEIVESHRGRNINRKALYPEGEIKYITTKDLSKNAMHFRMEESVLGIDADEIKGNIPRIRQGDILITLIGNDLKPNVFNDNLEAITDQNLIILRCLDNVLPEYLVRELRSELSLKQIDALRQQGTGISRVSRSNLLKIRIKLPSIEEQRRILLENLESSSSDKENKFDSDEFNFIATLKHTLTTPLSSLSRDFDLLKAFLSLKAKEGVISDEDILVRIYDFDDESNLQKYSLKATLDRCQRMLNDAHDHLSKAEQLIKIDTLKPKFKLMSIKSVLLSLEKDYPSIEFDFKGRDYELNIDKYSFRIMLNNFIKNAIKHGFEEIKNPSVLFRTEIERDKFDIEYVKIQYLNNGEPMSPEITTDKFLRKNSKSKKSAGDGYGGYLIYKTIEMHKGIVEIDEFTAEKEMDYNVCFNIYQKTNLMAKNDKPISALIIDDIQDYCDALEGSARAEQILLKSATNLEDGIQLLKDNKKIEFVILDGKCFVDGDQELSGSTSNNIPHRAKALIDEINRDQNREIGYCVNTGFVDDFQESFEGIFTVFEKRPTATDLFNYIKQTVSASEKRKLKRIYKEAFQAFDKGIINADKEELLVNLVSRLECNNYDKDGFNVGRELLEEIFLALINNYECIPDECLKHDGRPNLAYCSIFMGSMGTTRDLIISGISYPNAFDVPNHIGWTFGYLKENLSELSHTYAYDFNKYAFTSVAHGVLEILAWLPKFIEDNFE